MFVADVVREELNVLLTDEDTVDVPEGVKVPESDGVFEVDDVVDCDPARAKVDETEEDASNTVGDVDAVAEEVGVDEWEPVVEIVFVNKEVAEDVEDVVELPEGDPDTETLDVIVAAAVTVFVADTVGVSTAVALVLTVTVTLAVEVTVPEDVAVGLDVVHPVGVPLEETVIVAVELCDTVVLGEAEGEMEVDEVGVLVDDAVWLAEFVTEAVTVTVELLVELCVVEVVVEAVLDMSAVAVTHVVDDCELVTVNVSFVDPLDVAEPVPHGDGDKLPECVAEFERVPDAEFDIVTVAETLRKDVFDWDKLTVPVPLELLETVDVGEREPELELVEEGVKVPVTDTVNEAVVLTVTVEETVADSVADVVDEVVGDDEDVTDCE